MIEVKGKRIIVIGIARSGVGAANLLYRLGGHVTVMDKKDPGTLGDYLGRLHPGIHRYFGEPSPDLLRDVDLIIVSPGVPLGIAFLSEASRRGIGILGELELAYQAVRDRDTREGEKASFLAVTGTNGKSTTTILINEILRNSGFHTILGGNIGNALTEEIERERGKESVDFYITEVSSFQLETIDTFRPEGAALLNISPDHMDRYSSIEKYREAKCRIFMNQEDDDFLILNADDPLIGDIESEEIRKKSRRPRLYYFSREREVRGAYYRAGLIYFNLPHLGLTPSGSRIRSSLLRITGVHNTENVMAASLMALLSGCDFEAVRDTLMTFSGLEHRLEYVDEIGGVRFFNDSKGTNVGAVMKSLESFHDPVILIAGGRDKKSDFSLLRPLVRERVKAAILIGETRENLMKAISGSTEVYTEGSLADALNRSILIATPGDVVLLSPACASFDMFRDFEERGKVFKEIVLKIKDRGEKGEHVAS